MTSKAYRLTHFGDQRVFFSGGRLDETIVRANSGDEAVQLFLKTNAEQSVCLVTPISAEQPD